METTQLNVRIPADLKAQGDQVLAQAGVSASELVRSLWEYLAIFSAIPEFGKAAKPADGGSFVRTPQGSSDGLEPRGQNDDSITRGSAMVQTFFMHNGLQWGTQTCAAYEDLREDMHAQALAEHEALNA